MLKLIVFDCDGVMFNSKKANCMYYNHLLAHFGLPSMNGDEEDYVHMSSVADSVQHIFRHYRKPTLDEVHAFRKSCSYVPFLAYVITSYSIHYTKLYEARTKYNTSNS